MLIIDISPVTTPMSTAPYKGFNVLTMDTNGAYIETADATDVMSLSTSQPGSFRDGSYLQVDPAHSMVGETNVKYTFKLIPQNDIPIGSKIFIEFPSDQRISCGSNPAVLSYNGYGLEGIKLDTFKPVGSRLGDIQCNMVNNRLEIQDVFITADDYF